MVVKGAPICPPPGFPECLSRPIRWPLLSSPPPPSPSLNTHPLALPDCCIKLERAPLFVPEESSVYFFVTTAQLPKLGEVTSELVPR